MRGVIWALMMGLVATPALAGQGGTDVFTVPGTPPVQLNQDPGPSPIPITEPADKARSSKSGGDRSGGATRHDLSFSEVVGTWTGTVDEVDQAPYTIDLTFRPGGLGEVSYTGYDCDGVLGPIAEGAKLVFKETITTRRDICADGTVVITARGPELNWTWINEWNEVQATAVLRRKP